MVSIVYALSIASGTYYAKYILGDDNLVSIMGAVGLIPTVVGFAIVGPMTKKFGITKTLKIAFALGIFANAIRIIFPDSLIALLTLGMLSTFATIPMMCLGDTMTSMSMDYNDYLYHNKIVGMSASASSFGAKVANGLGGALIGWILSLSGFEKMKAAGGALTTPVRYGIYTFSIYLPLVIMVGLFLMMCAFDLEKKYPQIIAEIRARNAAEKS